MTPAFVRVLSVLGDFFWVATMVAFAWVTTYRVRSCQRRIRQLELKTGWIQATEAPGGQVTVRATFETGGSLGRKDEEKPYAS